MERYAWWALLWRSDNALDGKSRHFITENGVPVLFATRAAARDHARAKYGYIAKRKDLRSEPHGWRMPAPVRVKLYGKKSDLLA